MDFSRVAIPRFIKATNSGLQERQVLRRLKFLWERYRRTEITWQEILKIGPDALSLSNETVTESKRILDRIPGPDAEPCSVAGTLQGNEESEIGEGDSIAFQPTSEHVQQVSIYRSSRRPILAH